MRDRGHGFVHGDLPPWNPLFARDVDALIVRRMSGTLEWMRDDRPSLDHRPWGPAFVVDVRQALAEYLAS